MLAWLLITIASAGTIYVDAANPVLVKVEGDLVRKEPATRIVVPDLAEGPYKVEITNLFGKTLAFTDVEMTWDGEIHLAFDGRYLDQVNSAAEEVYGAATPDGTPMLSDVNFTAMMRKLVKGSTKKKLKHLDKFTVDHGLTMNQASDLLASFHTREDRLAARVMILDRITEPDKYAALNHHFAVRSDREKMHELFEAILAAQP